MKKYIIFLLVIVLLVMPENAEAEVYKVVSELPKENITLFAKQYEQHKMGTIAKISQRISSISFFISS